MAYYNKHSQESHYNMVRWNQIHISVKEMKYFFNFVMSLLLFLRGLDIDLFIIMQLDIHIKQLIGTTFVS